MLEDHDYAYACATRLLPVFRTHCQGDPMTDAAKKGITFLVIAFALFYLVTQPAAAADAVKAIGDGIGQAFQAIIKFFDALSS
jgi:hypothetical protein